MPSVIECRRFGKQIHSSIHSNIKHCLVFHKCRGSNSALCMRQVVPSAALIINNGTCYVQWSWRGG